MNENNNGRGIFYGVIGVATLIVAIIGATFAFFSASANSAVNAVTAGAASVGLTFTPGDDNNTALKGNLVPVKAADVTEWSVTGDAEFATFPGVTTSDCVDKLNNNICSVFEFNVKNPSTTAAQSIYFSIDPGLNGFYRALDTEGDDASLASNVTPNTHLSDLYMAIFKGTASQIGENWDLLHGVTDDGGDPNADASAAAVGKLVYGPVAVTDATISSTDLSNMTQRLAPEADVDYTILLWVQDAGKAQNGAQKANFAATVYVNTGDGSGVSGVLSTTSGT